MSEVNGIGKQKIGKENGHTETLCSFSYEKGMTEERADWKKARFVIF